MSTTSYQNLTGDFTEAEPFTATFHHLEEPVQIKGFSVTYDRKFNLGNFESLNPAMTIWVKTRVPEDMVFDLHHCKERLRRMTRENCRAQLQRMQSNDEVIFLGLQPPENGGEDPIFIRTMKPGRKRKLSKNESLPISRELPLKRDLPSAPLA